MFLYILTIKPDKIINHYYENEILVLSNSEENARIYANSISYKNNIKNVQYIKNLWSDSINSDIEKINTESLFYISNKYIFFETNIFNNIEEKKHSIISNEKDNELKFYYIYFNNDYEINNCNNIYIVSSFSIQKALIFFKKIYIKENNIKENNIKENNIKENILNYIKIHEIDINKNHLFGLEFDIQHIYNNLQ